MTGVYVGLGANIGNRRENLRAALRALDRRCGVHAVSSLYSAPALVAEGSPPGPDFLNAACELEDAPSPRALLELLKQIEHDLGRRASARWAPRPIDLDILLYGDAIIDTPDLRVPHRELIKRNFVMAPLAEIAPDALHPALGRSIGELAEDVDYDGLVHIHDPSWFRSSTT